MKIQSSRRGGIVGWAIFAVLLAVVAVPLAVWGTLVLTGRLAFAGPGPYAGWGFVWFPFGFLIFLLFVFFLVRLAFWGARWRGYGYHGYRGYYGGPWGWGAMGAGDAHEILQTRYARGEITRDQYAQMRRDLDAPPP